jgi:hypothetical protein
MRRRIVIILAIALGLAVTASPTVASASAPVHTGTVTVMLMTPPKAKLPLVNTGIVMENETGTIRSGLTDLAGQITLYDVPEGSHWHIIATPQIVLGQGQLLPGNKWGITVLAGEHSWVAVVLRIGGSIGGGVRNAAGPVGGVRVTATGGWSNKAYSTTTNGAGRYSIGGLPSGDYIVSYKYAGYTAATNERPVTAQYSTNAWSIWTGVDGYLTPSAP